MIKKLFLNIFILFINYNLSEDFNLEEKENNCFIDQENKNQEEESLNEEEFKNIMSDLNEDEKNHFQFCMNKILEHFNNLKDDEDLKLLEELLKKFNINLKLFITIVPFKISK